MLFKDDVKLCHIQGASRETDVFEMDVTEQVQGVEAWVGGQLNSSGHAISVVVTPQWTLEHRVFAYDRFVNTILRWVTHLFEQEGR